MTHWLDSTGRFALPSGWPEVTVRGFQQLASLPRTREAAASYFAGRSIQVNGLIADALAFLNTEPPTALPEPFNLGQYAYVQVELLRAAVSKGSVTDWLPAAFGLLRGRGLHGRFEQARATKLATACLDYPLPEVYPVVAHGLSELARLGDKYAELGQQCGCEGCAAGRAAGLGQLQALSFFNTLDALAERLGQTVEQVGQMPYDTVALMLLRAARQHSLQARIHENGKN